jgi:hypothetical protein
MNCVLCGELFVGAYDLDRQPMHRECGLREVLGGIGHLVAHEYWCLQRHDSDAGFTYRQSALLTDAWVHVMGVEAAVERG